MPRIAESDRRSLSRSAYTVHPSLHRAEHVSQMYDDAMNGVSAHLIRKTPNHKLTYTSELIPQRGMSGMWVDLSTSLDR